MMTSVRPTLFMRPGEIATIKQAAHYARRSEITIRRWCRQYGISRQATPNSPHEISWVALEMVLQGDFEALTVFHSGERASPLVQRYFDHLKIRDDQL